MIFQVVGTISEKSLGPKTVATGCHILKLKCTKFDFCWVSAPDPAGGACAPPGPLVGFKAPTSKGKEGKEKEEGRDGKERGKGSGSGSGGVDIAWSDL